MSTHEVSGYELIRNESAPTPELFGKAVSLDLSLLVKYPNNEKYQDSLDRVMARMRKQIADCMLRREYLFLRRYGAVLEHCRCDRNLRVRHIDHSDRVRITLEVLAHISGVASSGWSLESDLSFFEPGAEFGEFHKAIFRCLVASKEDKYWNLKEIGNLLPTHENEKLLSALRDMSQFIHHRTNTLGLIFYSFEYRLNLRGRRVWEVVASQESN